MVINQLYLFLIFITNGIVVGLLFDIFRILRKSFKTPNLITYIEDILFWILTGISIVFCMYKFSYGSLRLFMFLGLGFGIIIYMLTFSKIIIKILVFIITFLKNIIIKIIHIFLKPFEFIYKIFYKLLSKPISKISRKVTVKIEKEKIKIKKVKKRKKI